MRVSPVLQLWFWPTGCLSQPLLSAVNVHTWVCLFFYADPPCVCVCMCVCVCVCSRFSWARPSINPLALLHSVSLVVPADFSDILIPCFLIVLLFPCFHTLTSPPPPLRPLTPHSLKLPPCSVTPSPPPSSSLSIISSLLSPLTQTSLSLHLPAPLLPFISYILILHPICSPSIHLRFHLIPTSPLLFPYIFIWPVSTIASLVKLIHPGCEGLRPEQA